jgi:excinuclease ABC subunit C
MIDAKGQLIYVGKAKCLRSRLLSYFRVRSRDPKAGRVLQHTRAIVWEAGPSEFAALLRELELIRRWQPRFNVHGQPGRRRRTFVCLGRRPASYLFLARRPPAGATGFWGPIFAGHQAREAVRRLNDWFGLRDCPRSQVMHFADQGDLFPEPRAAGCIRHEIGTCLGPCAGACTRAAYARHVRSAAAFLDGSDLAPLERLEALMKTAAVAQEYERAAAYRDKYAALTWMHEHLDRLRRARDRQTFIYPVVGVDGSELWYLVRRGFVAAAVPRPTDATSATLAANTIAEVFEQPRPWAEPTRADSIDGVLLVAAWFKRYPMECDRTLTPAAAREICAAAIQ